MPAIFKSVFTAYRRAFAGLPQEVWWLAAAALVNRAGTMVLPFLSLYLVKALGWDVSATKSVLFAYGFGTVVGSYCGGRATDRWGSHAVHRASLIGGGALFFVVPFVRDPASLALTVFALSAINDAFRPAVMAATSAAAPPQGRARALALLRLTTNLGMGIGPAAGGILAAIDYRWLFFIDGTTTWLAAAVLIVAFRRTESKHGSGVPPIRLGAWAPLKDGPFVLLLLAIFVLANAFFMIFIVLPLYLERVVGLHETTIGWVLASNAFLIVVFEMVLISRVEHLKKIRVFAVGCALTAIGLGIIPLGTSIPFLLFTVVIWSFGEMLSLPMSNVIVADRGHEAGQPGAYMGLYSLAFALASLVAPVAGLTLWDSFGPSMVWYATGATGLVVAAACLSASHRFRRIPRT